jgi:hypothetical protein
MEIEEAATAINQLIDNGRLGMILLGQGYRIGDDYEIACVANALTISSQHTLDLRREGEVLRGTAFFDPDLVPESYRSRVNPNGVVPIGIEIALHQVLKVVDFEDTEELLS